MTNGGFSSVYDVKDLDNYYSNCVIGGPGAFMIPVNDWSQFPEAIRRKLVLELAANLDRVASLNYAAINCLRSTRSCCGEREYSSR